MDPWPQQRKEPKAPDKSIEALNNKDSNIIMKIKSESSYATCGKTDNYTPRVLAPNKDSSISSLNEPDLKALLEEAMAYKRPKDIQGKSDLFKELLHSVEAEKKFTALSRPEKPNNRKPRRKQMNKKDIDKTTNEGPFQDLIVHVSSDSDGPPKRPVKYSLKCPSSLPQVVPVSAVTVCDENNPEIAALLQNGSFDNLEQLQQYIAKEANVYQLKEPVDARVGFPLTISPYAEKKQDDNFVQLGLNSGTSPSYPPKDTADASIVSKECLSDSKKTIDENGNSVGTSRMDSLAERKAKARRLKAKNDKNTILSQHIEGHRSDIAQDIDALMKYIESPNIDGSKSRPRNVMSFSKHSNRVSHKIGQIRDKSSDTFSGKIQKHKENKLQKSSSLEEVSISKFEDLTLNKKSAESSKDVQHRSDIKAFSYLSQEITTSFDIKSPKKEVPFQQDRLESEVFDADFLPVTKKSRKKKNVCENHIRNKISKINVGFRGEKILGSYIGKSQDLESFTVSTREFQRRKSISSVPSSDKSGDTSDMDSVHSFPVSSNKGRAIKNNVSASVGSTPQISYADMARSVPSPLRTYNEPIINESKNKIFVDSSLVSDENFQQLSLSDAIPTVVVQLPAKKHLGGSVHNLKDEYPPLFAEMCDKAYSCKDMFVEYTVVVPKRSSSIPESNCVNVEETVLIDMPSLKSDAPALEGLNLALDNKLPTKRPPVILMNSNANDSNDVNDLVFGFEVNEQLLCSSNTELMKSSDIVCNNNVDNRICEKKLSVDQTFSDSSNGMNTVIRDDDSNQINQENFVEIVEYISKEWDLIIKEWETSSEEKKDKVQYFTP
ncbi:unnamed protein product [Nezara viridula]|uniref:Uncharacterized protein n=1 Tax=Nezara viridula TaxID=85310 RepID=A0A9P0EDD6_NEZVI|nr:unnamed protein product [Nezara viridula]